jgi:integrase
LRFSDLIKINRTNITEGGNGLFFLNGIAVKTDTPFNIELSNRTYEIFERNNFTLNLMSNQKANLYLKKLLEQIDEFQKFSSKYDYKDEQGQTHHYRLFELVSFHTARRSFITTLLDNRYSINEIMTRTGHSKPSTLEKYINPNETLGRTIIDIFDY